MAGDVVIVHVLNSSRVSGIESLVLPALSSLGVPVVAVFLVEDRLGAEALGGRDFAVAHGLHVETVRVRGRVDVRAMTELARVLVRLAPLVVHAHDPKASTYALAAARLARSRAALFSTHHGVRGRPGRTRLYERFYVHTVLPCFDRVLAVSTPDFAELAARGGERVRLHVNGADARHVAPGERQLVSSQIRRAWPLPPCARADGVGLLGIVGRLAPEKRHDRALAALAALRRRDPSLRWHLVCFGTGPRAGALADQVRALGLSDDVTLAGYRARAGDEMAGFDVLLSLSDAEGLPINVVEAGWAGTPVVATAVGGVRDVLGKPPAGVLVGAGESPASIGDAIGALLRDRDRRELFGRLLQRRVVERFSSALWLDRLRELYAPFVPELARRATDERRQEELCSA